MYVTVAFINFIRESVKLISEKYMVPRLRHGPASPVDVSDRKANLYVKIRERYGLSRTAMGKVLGFGVNQWRLYEEGLEPKKSHRLLVALLSDPRSFKSMLVTNERAVVLALGIPRYAKLMAKVLESVREFGKLEADRYRDCVDSLWK